jgi:DNA adenine methylase
MMKFYSPLRYPGGKSCIFPFISRIFYENNLIGMNYAEPYAGGAGLALKLLFEEYVNKIYINDLDYSIYSFWKTILERNEEFCEWVENVRVSVKNWQHYKDIQTNIASVSQFELAKSTFFLNRTNISGVIKGGIIGGLKQTGNYKIDARFNKADLVNRIKRIAEFRERIVLSNDDGIAFLKKLERRKDDIFVYVDPPYYQKGADLYMNFYSKKDHRRLSQHISKLKSKWLVSYDNHEFITSLYTDQRKVVYQLSQCASNRVGDEILIFSDDMCFSDSIIKLKSPALII